MKENIRLLLTHSVYYLCAWKINVQCYPKDPLSETYSCLSKAIQMETDPDSAGSGCFGRFQVFFSRLSESRENGFCSNQIYYKIYIPKTATKLHFPLYLIKFSVVDRDNTVYRSTIRPLNRHMMVILYSFFTLKESKIEQLTPNIYFRLKKDYHW